MCPESALGAPSGSLTWLQKPNYLIKGLGFRVNYLKEWGTL